MRPCFALYRFRARVLITLGHRLETPLVEETYKDNSLSQLRCFRLHLR